MAVQGDGKIVVAGSSYQGPGPNYDFALARFNSDAALDNMFSGDGKQTTDFAGRSDFGGGVAIQADGKIVVAGRSDQGATGNDFALARYVVKPSAPRPPTPRVSALAPTPPATATCDGRAATKLGTSADDNLVGTSGDDVIVTGAGKDKVDGRGG